MIEFLCPNGHRIRCPAEQAGRAAKCPRCGIKFRVPDAAETDISEASGSGVSHPEFTDSDVVGKRPPALTGGSQKEPQIEFLCPNGHRLFGPAALQGRAGECPECGSRFRIPTYEDASSTETPPDSSAGQGTAATDAPPTRLPSHPARLMPVLATAAGSTIAAAELPSPSMAALFARLWDSKPAGAAVEVWLGDQPVVPELFLKRLSQESHLAVFAVKEADGRWSIVATPWQQIVRATIRGIQELPKELAD
ncbi:MAG: hypothetical protein ABFC96_03985 [Thermoguttaceae bacterium]